MSAVATSELWGFGIYLVLRSYFPGSPRGNPEAAVCFSYHTPLLEPHQPFLEHCQPPQGPHSSHYQTLPHEKSRPERPSCPPPSLTLTFLGPSSYNFHFFSYNRFSFSSSQTVIILAFAVSKCPRWSRGLGGYPVTLHQPPPFDPGATESSVSGSEVGTRLF